MSVAVRNHVAVPFFDRVPSRVKDLVITTFDNIVERGQSTREAYHFFGNAVKKRNVEGPTFDEFAHWHERVKNGLIDRPHPADTIVDCFIRDLGKGRPSASEVVYFNELQTANTPETAREAGLRIKQARAIVAAAHALNEAKLAAGYSPASITLDDTILQQALTDLLAAEADATVMDADVHMTAGNKLVDLLLGEGDADIDDKLVGCLTMDMQPELCRLLVRSDAAKSR
ncbi:hypothetical protein AGR7C_Lc100122 [Agrobacterium deltaense Zutra 3/1]|uniref:Uncharacterized protein n=1 Tax=Agrobacterium deltaense Zutra 3/1 TaxID=1183427 RepID=A0A1S7QS69_9HYPH|nr:hypothetical protein [Agrobacterium deltaense]CUX41365.1 hypothetical protein AGR7C_Lc100122 [Agrobacterium deltaense Zutra 3/1]